jgi:hypothetical protein
LTARLSRAWFGRAWVVQEAVFAKRLYLWWGTIFLDWWNLVPVVRMLADEKVVSDMVRTMGNLLRREYDAWLGRKVATFSIKNEERKVPTAGTTDADIRNNIKRAVAL